MSINSAPISLSESQIVPNSPEDEPKVLHAETHVPIKKTKKRSRMEDSLEQLTNLIANITESYSTALFVADQQNKILHCLAHHSLSRDFIEGVTIPYGRGLVGWTAENKLRITVCPFEHDSSTLLYYPTDQGLKSFIAVPIISKNGCLLGVIACDSKKNYAFAKITEKLLTECAVQAQILIDLHLDNQKLSENAPNPNLKSELETVFTLLKKARSEEQLFEGLCQIPQSLIAREATIALVTSHEGFGEATFYTNAKESRIEHHLVELVCKHKKILSTERSVHVLPHDDIKARSFLSVPFNVFGNEAGALNVLSAPFKGFSPSDIEALEKLAALVSQELERLRSKTITASRQIGPSLLPWKHFISQSNILLGIGNDSKMGNRSHIANYSLVRVQLNNLFTLEKNIGVKNVAEIHEQILRFVQQLATQPMLASSPYGTSIYIMGEKDQLESLTQRLAKVISKIPLMDNLDFYEPIPSDASKLLSENLEISNITLHSSIGSIDECILEKRAEIKQVEIENKAPIKKAPVAPQSPIEKIASIMSTSSNKPKTGFDQRLNNALLKTENKRSEDEFILGETTEEEKKEVVNARFW